MLRYGLVIIAMVLLCCESEPKQTEKDDEIIRNYLSVHKIDAQKHPSGLYYTIEVDGSGGHPNMSSVVEVGYRGYLTDGHVFDQTEGETTISFELSRLIEGWQIAIPLLERGGEGTFYLPSALGYGSRAVGTIPANSVLIFEIRLVDFN